MAWTSPGTAVVGQLLTASYWNAQVRDNLLFLFNQPSARVTHNANQSIASATVTALAFNTERWDTDTIHDPVTNNSRLTCKTAGKYLIWANINWDASNGGTFREARFRVSGGSDYALQGAQVANGLTGGGTGAANMILTAIVDLAVNDYVELLVRHDVGAPINVNVVGVSSPEFGMQRLGA